MPKPDLAKVPVKTGSIYPPKPGFRHRHDTADKTALVLTGDGSLVADAQSTRHPGAAACWPAGRPVARGRENRNVLVTGTRNPTGTSHIPDHDLITHKDGSARHNCHTDATPRPPGEHR